VIRKSFGPQAGYNAHGLPFRFDETADEKLHHQLGGRFGCSIWVRFHCDEVPLSLTRAGLSLPLPASRPISSWAIR
jgi:hypothetical protein